MTYPFDLFLHPRKITEIYGPPGTGKTQFCITAAVEYAKKGGDVVYIDTENAVQETRVRQIIKAQGGDEEQILSQIRLFKVNTAAQFETMMLNLDTYLEDASMCIIDNVASHLRKNQNSIEQIKKIRKVSQALLRSAARYQIPILRTNTITMNGPTLGDSFGYSSTIRAEFKKGSWRLEKGEQGEGTFDLESGGFVALFDKRSTENQRFNHTKTKVDR